MPVAATSMLTIYDQGWQRPRTIPASQVVATWAVNQPSTLSAIVTMNDVARLGRPDVIGAWVYWEHPIQGPFGGVIDDDPSDLGNGTIAITVTGLGETLLMDRTTPVLLEPDTGHAGAVIRRAMTLSQTADPLPFRSVQWDESGPVAEVEWRGEPIWDVIQNVLDQTGQEMQITIDRDRNLDLVIREQIGVDRTSSVLIAEGYHVAGGRIDHSRLSVTNDITGIAADEDWERSANARIENETSRARYGRRQAVRRYENVVSPLSVKSKVRTDIRNEAVAPHLPTITLPPMHTVGLKIREGDTIRYWSRGANRETRFRVYSRTIRDEALELAGIAIEVRVPPVVPPFTPDVLGGMIAWYDASDLSTLQLAGASVTQWNDKSGNGWSLGTASGFTSPSYVPNTLITKPVVRFASTNSLNSVTQTWAAYNAATVFLVAKRTGSGTGINALNGIIGSGVDPLSATGPDNWQVGYDGADKIQGVTRGNAGDSSFSHSTAWGTSAFHVVSAVFDMSLSTNEATVYDNGASTGTRPSNLNNTANYSAGNTFAISSGGFLGDIAEIIVYSVALNASQRGAVETYLKAKWGL